MVEFSDSVYKFTDPVRLFKSNDPYYWEVDNIPLKQLQENSLWLKDQLAKLTTTGGAGGGGGGSGDLSIVVRGQLDELRPYAVGTDRKVRVKPGRYTARVNDAYKVDALGYLAQEVGSAWGAIDKFWNYTSQAGSSAFNATLLAALDKFKNTVAKSADSKFMTGLAERVFTYPIMTEDYKSSYVNTTSPTVNPDNVNQTDVSVPFPLSKVISWVKRNPGLSHPDYQWAALWSPFEDASQESVGFRDLAKIENAFIKRWRGVARTSIVDVPDELDITIPSFSTEDFFYTDENGDKVVLTNATQRIDLLFIYSKTIDTSAVTIGKYTANVPTKISKAELGIVKGAGIGVDFRNPTDETIVSNAQAPDGTTQILPDINDQNNAAGGFKGLNVHGSFPSPDDLMNQAPLLSEDLETDSYELIGQSILPLAYIVVKKNDPFVSEDEVIDIRPFLRTTELSYNERAGLAAANPQISIGNPVVSKALLDRDSARAKIAIDDAKSDLQNQMDVFHSNQPKVLATGMIYGGSYFGPESTLIHYELSQEGGNSAATQDEAWTVIRTKYGIPDSVSRPLNPDWDLAKHAEFLGDGGVDPTDYVNWLLNISRTGGNSNNLTRPVWASFATSAQAEDADNATEIRSANRLQELSTRQRGFSGQQANFVSDGVGLSIPFVSKTVTMDLSQLANPITGEGTTFSDYYVDVDYWNCTPLSDGGAIPPQGYNKSNSSAFAHNDAEAAVAGSNGVWISRKAIVNNIATFTIYVSWAHGMKANHLTGTSTSNWSGVLRNQEGGAYSRYAGWTVVTEDMRNRTFTFSEQGSGYQTYDKAFGYGFCILPTVSFKVVGYPSGYSNSFHSLGGTGATITPY